MSDIRFNQWLHQSGTGGVSQVDGGHVGIGTTNPEIAVHSGNSKILNVGIVTASTYYGDGSNLSGISVATDKIIEGDTKVEVVDSGSQYIVGEVNGGEKIRITSGGLVGINTASPDRSLHVFSTNGTVALFESSNANTISQIVFQGHGASALPNIGATGENLHFTTANTESLLIKSDKTSIFSGTEVKLYNAANTSNTYFYAQNTGAGNAGIKLKNQDGEWTIIANDFLRFRDEDTGTDRLRIASNGDFGFNDDSPTAHASGNNTVLSIKGKGSSYSGKIDFKDSDGNLDSYINSDNATLQIYCDPNSQNGNTVMTFSVHGSNRMRIGAGGDVDVETGDIFFSTAGKGIVLGNTSNTDANTLDDYEEGTFTPVMKFGGGNTGMSLGNVEAVYTKIGRMVYATIRFTMSGKGSSTGQLTFEGLPHTVGDVLSTTSVQGGFDLQYLQGNVNAHEIKVYPWESTSTLKAFKRSNQNSTTSDFTDSDISGQFDGRISFFYTADN